MIKNQIKISKHTDLLAMKRQWTYGPTLLPWNDYFHTSGHDGSIHRADLCRSIKINIQELIQNMAQ